MQIIGKIIILQKIDKKNVILTHWEKNIYKKSLKNYKIVFIFIYFILYRIQIILIKRNYEFSCL